MFVNDPNSPYYTGEKKENWRMGREKYLAQAGLETGEFIGRYGWRASTYASGTLTAGALMGRPMGGLASGYKFGIVGSQFMSLPIAAYRFSTAPRGKSIGNAMGGFMGSTFGAVVGGIFGGPIGAIAGAAVLSKPIEDVTSKVINKFSSIGRTSASLRAGGNYKDTQVAYTMRSRAAQELNGSLMNAKMYLGQEAQYAFE
jgi:hypothetical protein